MAFPRIMNEVPLAALEVHLQRQVESARQAFARGNFDYALDLCRDVLAAAPACVPVRKLQRAAHLKRGPGGGRLARALRCVPAAPALLSGRLALAQDPVRAIRNAQKVIEAEPHSAAGLKLLGAAATALGWTETAVFAFDALRERAPHDVANLVALGRAHLAAGRASAAGQWADAALRLEPHGVAAQTLRKDASVAQTMQEGRWEEDGDFRAKVRVQP